MVDQLSLIRSGPAKPDRILLLLPGGGQGAEAFTEHVAALDPHQRWLVAVAQPRLTTRFGPLWYDVEPHYDLDAAADTVLAVAAAAESLMQETGVGPDHLVLAGFSQGAVISLATLVDPRVEFRPAAVAALAGYRFSGEDDIEMARAKGVPVLVAHGRDDTGVFATKGWSAACELQKAGAALTWREVDGGHHISPYLLAELRSWLEAFERGEHPSDDPDRAIPCPVPTIELPDRPMRSARKGDQVRPV
jgi:phospholipase/carboxylesterase